MREEGEGDEEEEKGGHWFLVALYPKDRRIAIRDPVVLGLRCHVYFSHSGPRTELSLTYFCPLWS